MYSFHFCHREAAKLEIKVLEKIQQRDRNGRRFAYNLVALCVRQLFTENCGLTCIVDFKVSQAMIVVITFISPSSRVNNLLYS